ncbi:hypothetical protein Dimus_012014 [Dionaea muscipula]
MEIQKKSSIETEPQTLSVQQIEFARDAALYVINTRSFEEALQIFTQGLQPVVLVGKQDDDGAEMADSDEEEEEEEEEEEDYYYFPDYHFNDLLLRPRRFKDTVTAPF